MLEDTPRKILMILTHFSGHFRRMPSLQELERRSGRKPGQILEALKALVKEHYIEWTPGTPPETAQIIEGWERPEPGQRSHHNSSGPGNLDYWTHY